jgi:hypothetical protein
MADSQAQSSRKDPIDPDPAAVVPFARPLDGKSPPVLSYAVVAPVEQVTVARVASGAEAEMISDQLAAAGIPSQIIDRNVEVLGPYAPGSSVKVIALARDAERATEVMRDEVEPDGQPDVPLDEEGRPIGLAVAAAFDQPRLLRHAAATLGAGRITPYVPTLIPRSQSRPGEGKRFVLRVQVDDLQRAQSLLEEPDEQAEYEEPNLHCPKCHAWRVYKNTSIVQEVSRFFGFGREQPAEYECLSCHHRGPQAEFIGGGEA